MLALLIEDRIAEVWTLHSRGRPINDDVRSNRIEAIIGDSKLQQFLELERHLRDYSELQNIGSMLQQNGLPLTDEQRDGLFQILVAARDLSKGFSPSDAERHSIEYLEDRLIQKDAYERHVLELAPSVLSLEQVRHLFEQYQYLSYERAYALQLQKRQRADPTTEEAPLWYPTWSNWQ